METTMENVETTMENVGLVQECLNEMRLPHKSLDQMTSIQLGELKGKIDTKYKHLQKGIQDCQHPVYVRAFIDLFLKEKFPQWSPTIESKGKKFERILANVDDPVINAIRYILSKNGTLAAFGREIVHGGSEFAGTKVHMKKFPKDATPYVLECIKSFGNPIWVKAGELMIAAILNDEEKIVSMLKEIQAPKISSDDVEELYQLTVLRIENLTPKYFDDKKKIREQFKDQSPTVIAFENKNHTNVVYVKFSIFEDAHGAWEKVTNNLKDFVKGADEKDVRIKWIQYW